MKSNAILSLFFVMVLMCACKQDNSGVQLIPITHKSNFFKVTLDATVKENDDFSLYYTTDGTIDFTQIKPLWTAVKRNDKPQQVVFSLPANVRPTQLRIDLGRNQEQKDVYLTKITMSYKGKQLELPGTFIFSYFRPDFSKTTFNASSGLIRGIVKNGVRQSPSLYPKGNELQDKIELLTE